jgi:hypothetical protein
MKARVLAATSTIALVFGVGATVGDIGSCGQSPTDLDAAVFASARKTVDCERCTECGLTTARCAAACSDAGPTETFPPNCEPLYQDGVVCLRALLSASCSDYAQYVDDTERLVPTECQFCLGTTDGGAAAPDAEAGP